MPEPEPAPTGADEKPTITSAAELGLALQNAREILLYSYFSNNIEVSEFTVGKITYFDRKGDGDFAQKLAAWLFDTTGQTWMLERDMESHHTKTAAEQKRAELESDPLVANAMNLFGDAEIISVSK